MADTIQVKQVELETVTAAADDGSQGAGRAHLTTAIGTSADALVVAEAHLHSLLNTSSVNDDAVGVGQASVIELIGGVGGEPGQMVISQVEMTSVIDVNPDDQFGFQPSGAVVRGATLRNVRVIGGSRMAEPVDPFDPRDQRAQIGYAAMRPSPYPYLPPALPPEFDAYRVVIRRVYGSGEEDNFGRTFHEMWDRTTRTQCRISGVSFVPKGGELPYYNGTSGVTRFPSQTAGQTDDPKYQKVYTDPRQLFSPLPARDALNETFADYAFYPFDTESGFPKVVDYVFPTNDQPIDRVEIRFPRLYSDRYWPTQFDVERYDRIDRVWRTIGRSPTDYGYEDVVENRQGGNVSYRRWVLPLNPDRNFLNLPHRFWRVKWSSEESIAVSPFLDKMQFRQQIGIEEFPTGGVPIASSVYGGYESAINDVFKLTPNANFRFARYDQIGSRYYTWFGYRYAEPVRIQEVVMRFSTNNNKWNYSGLFDVEASDDGETWWTVYTCPTRQRGWGTEDRVFTFHPTVTAGPV